jgi:hypothetical protein
MMKRSDLFQYQKDATREMVKAQQLACFLEPGWG